MGPRSTSRSTDERGRDAATSGRGRTSDVGTAASGTSDDVVVGVVRAPHGLRGEVKVDSRTDVPDRFRKGSRLLCDGIGELVIASVRGPAEIPIVRFEGHHSRSDAERIKGRSLSVSRGDARRATKGSYLWADLIGLRVETPEGKVLGSIREVLRAGAADVLVVRGDDPRDEVLLPAIASVVREVDVDAGRVVVVPQEVLE